MRTSQALKRIPRVCQLGGQRARTMFAAAAAERTPLTVPLPGVEIATPGAAVAASTQTTTLSNGLKVVSENTPGATTCLGIFVGAGSRNETDANAGATHLLEHMAFKTTDSRSHFRTVHEVEHLGANLVAQAGREELSYSAEILSEHAPALLEIMADSVLNPAFKSHEVEEQKEVVAVDLQDAQMNCNNLTTEAAHLAAYGNTGLGRSLMASSKGLSNLTSESLQAYVSEVMTGGNVVVAGAGVDHATFVSQVESLFGGMAAGSAPALEAAKYVGGQYHMPADTMDGLSHVALAFQGPSWNDADLIPMCVLNTLMGGGGSFSAGGPGKGMYSRLYTNVLNKHGWVQNATAFNNCYADSGLFGIYGAAEPKHVPMLVQVLAEQLKNMGAALTDEEVSRAKNMTKSSVLMNLESKPIILEDMGKQVLCYGKRLSAAEVCSQIDAVSAADIQAVATKMVGSPLTYAAYGETHSLPRYDMISSFLK